MVKARQRKEEREGENLGQIGWYAMFDHICGNGLNRTVFISFLRGVIDDQSNCGEFPSLASRLVFSVATEMEGGMKRAEEKENRM